MRGDFVCLCRCYVFVACRMGGCDGGASDSFLKGASSFTPPPQHAHKHTKTTVTPHAITHLQHLDPAGHGERGVAWV